MPITLILDGIRREPLGGYLKALGVLRLVSAQADPQARGWWRGATFCIESSLDRGQLLNFFVERYAPTPVIAPWNGGSGFHPGDNQDALLAIRATLDPRFSGYRETLDIVFRSLPLPSSSIPIAEALHAVLASGEKAAAEARDLRAVIVASPAIGNWETLPLDTAISRTDLPKDCQRALKKLRTAFNRSFRGEAWKIATLRSCRNLLPDAAIDWLDAVAVLTDRSATVYPPILGSGGNEGRLDYTSAFMRRLTELFLDGKPGANLRLLRNALFSEATDSLPMASVGQFDPGRAGGFNQGPGIENKDFPTNPWNFVLMMEGTVAWASGVVRRNSPSSPRLASSPFTVLSRSVGYSSSAQQDEDNARAELWMPTWERPARFDEICTILRESRVQIAGRQVRDGLDFAEAAAALGVDRGLSGFVRTSLLKRRGDNFIALPLGFFPVQDRPDVALVEQLRRTLSPVDALLRKDNPPASLVSLRRQLDEGLYEFLLRGDAPSALQILRTVGQLEKYLAKRASGLTSPLSGFAPEWATLADDGSLELRIALALAAIARADDVGPLRANLAPVDPKKPWVWATSGRQVAWTGSSVPHRMLAVIRRRMMDAARHVSRRNPLAAPIALNPSDSAAFVEGRTDDSLIEDLLFAFSVVDWGSEKAATVLDGARQRWRLPENSGFVPREYALLKLLFLPRELTFDGGAPVSIRPEPSVLYLLQGGQISEACNLATRRLRSSGFVPAAVNYRDELDGVRLAASLLIPVHSSRRLAALVLVESSKENQ